MLKGEKILITGLTGNLGGTIAEELAKDNEVWGLARFSRAGQREYWEKAGVKTIVGDYGANELGGVPKDCKYVLHIAADCRPDSEAAGMRANAEGLAFLMDHCKKAKAFMSVSTVGVYANSGDPNHLYNEKDVTGSGTLGHYTGTKLAGEGVANAMARLLNLPTVIARMAVQYGHYKEFGLPGHLLRIILAGKPVPLSSIWTNRHSLISNDDCVRFIEPLLAAASVPATTVNWCGDVAIPAKEMCDYLGELAGVKVTYTTTEAGWSSFPADPAKRLAITGPCQVEWRDGIRKMYEAVNAQMRAELAAA
jgi:UDP-glucuronate 4-epimerase